MPLGSQSPTLTVLRASFKLSSVRCARGSLSSRVPNLRPSNLRDSRAQKSGHSEDPAKRLGGNAEDGDEARTEKDTL